MTPTLFKGLRETKSAIKDAIRSNATMNSGNPASTAKLLDETQDIDTVKWILAETVKANDWDGRYSRKVKEWANQLYIPVLHSENGREHGAIDGPHPAHINQLIEAIMKL